MPTPQTTMHVHRSVSVPLSQQRAFDLFTARMGAFWPREHSIGTVPMEDVVVEPFVGGRWYERGADGSDCNWGRVAAWEPPGRVVLLWQIGADWQYHHDLETQVEITFTDEAAARTRVDLVHHLDQYGQDAEAIRAVFDSPGGWTGAMTAYAAAAEVLSR